MITTAFSALKEDAASYSWTACIWQAAMFVYCSSIYKIYKIFCFMGHRLDVPSVGHQSLSNRDKCFFNWSVESKRF